MVEGCMIKTMTQAAFEAFFGQQSISLCSHPVQTEETSFKTHDLFQKLVGCPSLCNTGQLIIHHLQLHFLNTTAMSDLLYWVRL